MTTRSDPVGKGTDLCGKCGGAKEASRRGSQNCRACDKGMTKRSVRRFRLTLSVPEPTWDRLSERAKDTDESHYKVAQRVLDEWAAGQGATSSTEPVPEKRPPVDKAVLERAVLWMARTDRVKPEAVTTKSALFDWCVSQGFKP